MNLVTVIRELLFSHDCVILPGFGGFIGNYSPAHNEKGTNTFHPPAKLISFNRNLNHNDGLITGVVSVRTGLGYGDSRNLVGEFVDDIKRRLSKGEKVEFENIGSFTTNREGSYVFEPDRGMNFNLESFGLTPFTFPPLAGAGAGQTRRPRGGEMEMKASSNGMRKLLWRAAVIIPLATALVAVPLTTDIFRTKAQRTGLYTIPAPAAANRTADVEAQTQGTVTAGADTGSAAAEGTSGDAGLAIMPEAPPEAAETFHVIAGSFMSRENADVLVKILAGQGYEASVFDGPNGFYRVSAMKCGSLSEAVKAKDVLKVKYPGAWVNRTN